MLLPPDPTLPPRTGLWLIRVTYVYWGLLGMIGLLMFVWPHFDHALSIMRILCGALILDLLVAIMLLARQRRWWHVGAIGLLMFVPHLLLQWEPAPLIPPLPAHPGL